MFVNLFDFEVRMGKGLGAEEADAEWLCTVKCELRSLSVWVVLPVDAKGLCFLRKPCCPPQVYLHGKGLQGGGVGTTLQMGLLRSSELK